MTVNACWSDHGTPPRGDAAAPALPVRTRAASVSFTSAGGSLASARRVRDISCGDRASPRRGSMTSLIFAALFLPVSHFGISSTSLRARLVTALGERGFQGLYSLVSVVAF